MIVVADTSPINYLVLIEQVEVLRNLYGRILIPHSVWEELQDRNTPAPVRTWISSSPSWLEVHKLSQPFDQALSFLDRGEQEAISLARELSADLLLADETLARAEARRRGQAVIGTLGVLRTAARANLLSLPDTLSKLQTTSFFVAPELIDSLLAEDAERLRSARP